MPRDTLTRTRWLTFAVLAVTGWTVLTALDVVATMQPFWEPASPGRTAATGVVGLVVLVGALVLLVTVLGELGEPEPAPDAWPPER